MSRKGKAAVWVLCALCCAGVATLACIWAAWRIDDVLEARRER